MEPDTTAAGHDADPGVLEPHAGRTRGRTRVAIAIVVVVLGVFLFGWLLDYVTASPALCSSCHEMAPRAESWEQSAHAHVSCVECHQEPHPWYAVPQRLVGRAGILVRDVTSHMAGDYDDPVDASQSADSPIADETCLQCHDADRKATSGYRIIIDHVEHAKLNGSCVSCHVRTAHPLESRGRALSLMAQCFTCHGTAEKPEASAECDVCHPSDYEPKPAAHMEQEWMRDHGQVALTDARLCGMCHEKAMCEQCHGLEMPHPDDWAKGATGHGVVARTDRAVCTQCHGDRLDMCTMCHHSDYDPNRGTWIKQHFLNVRERGATYCMSECHSPVFCIDCHATEVPASQ